MKIDIIDIKEGGGCSLFCKNIFKSILYPTDFSNDAEKVLPYIKKGLDRAKSVVYTY